MSGVTQLALASGPAAHDPASAVFVPLGAAEHPANRSAVRRSRTLATARVSFQQRQGARAERHLPRVAGTTDRETMRARWDAQHLTGRSTSDNVVLLGGEDFNHGGVDA
ncbi:MAG: hypothetical protein ACRDMH_17420 [Solirubrobacterales bacterium]